MRKKHAAVAEEASVDMTPMLDIVFIMLIFFIVTTSFVKESGLEVLRPKSQNAPTNPTNVTMSIKIDQNGKVLFNNRQVDMRRLVANIQSFLAENNVTSAGVMAHPQASHGIVVEAIDQIKAAGIEQISVLVEKK